MDRRKFVVAGGAAAVATTLTAVTGGMPAAAASIIGTDPASTAEHARRVLDQVNVDLGLVNPAGLQRLFDRAYADYLASPPRDPNANDLDAWIRGRMVPLCGTESFATAVTELPQTRSLLAFSFLAYSQHQDTALPPLDQSMRVPALFRLLEPDFLPVLVSQIEEKCLTSREFALALQTSSAELDRILAEKMRGLSAKAGKARVNTPPGNAADTLGYIAGVFVFLGFLYWIKGGLKND